MGHLLSARSEVEILEVDLDKCQSYGNCLFAAPDMFDLSPDTGQPVLLQSVWPEVDRPAIATAVAGCPASALSLRDIEGNG